MTAFLEYIAAWDAVRAQIEEIEKTLKPLKARELEMRKALAESIQAALGDQLKEGMNIYKLEDGRSLALGYKLDRKIEESEIPAAREAYTQLNDRPVEFDALLRVKYELSKRDFDKLSDSAKAAISDMIITKPAAPTLEIRG